MITLKQGTISYYNIEKMILATDVEILLPKLTGLSLEAAHEKTHKET
jgi:hypothetical protein